MSAPENAMPANLEAEQALLGALLLSPDTVHDLDGTVRAEHFAEPFHGRLFEAVRDAALKGRAVDPRLLAQGFEADAAWRDLGGTAYLGELLDHAPPPATAPDFARTVAALHTRRELVVAGKDIAEAARRDTDAGEVLALAERRLAEIAGGTVAAESWRNPERLIADAIADARARAGRIAYPFGVEALDQQTGGLNAGELTILAARPGMGKTVAAQTVARASAATGRGVCLFSLEMGATPLGLRLASDLMFNRMAPTYSGQSTNLTADAAMKGRLTTEEWARLAEAENIVRGWPLYIDTRPGLTLQQVESAARRAHARWSRAGVKPGPVLIDHLGKLRPGTDRGGNLYAETADLSAGAAEMAKRLGVPVVALVQLNRGVESRDDKRPGLADLRNAGQLEEDARQVLMLYRPEYYLRAPIGRESFEQEAERRAKLEDARHKLFFLIEKNSHGPVGQVQAFCDVACSAIRDWEA
jgi:replicative DNA helicase